MTTGENIGRIAKEKGISLHKLSDKAEVPYTTLYSIVKRKSDKVDVETLRKIAFALDLHPIEVMGDATADMVLYGMELFERAISSAHEGTLGNGKTLAGSQAFLESRMKEAFSALNETGQTVACERVEELAEMPKYKRPEEPNTPSDGDNES